MWASSDGVLAQVAFSRIRTFDSSQTPRREECATAARALAAVHLVAFEAALKGSMANASDERETFVLAGHSQVSGLEHRLRQRDAELAAALAQLARLKAETTRMREWPVSRIGRLLQRSRPRSSHGGTQPAQRRGACLTPRNTGLA